MSRFSLQASVAANLLIDHSHSISVAESSTGGLIAASLLSVPGASRYFMGGTVIYTIKSRRAFLDLDSEHIKTLKPLTEEMALEFARAARAKLDTTWGIAELGVAGPGGTPYSDAIGISVIAISGPVDGSVIIKTQSNDREENMQVFTDRALQLLVQTLASI
ncbi:MAG: CinA family protein [Gammaproteobacteria bacterium]|nr:CinA family protein [Gammaproteobacteria bacterium]MDG2337471.1 CinA family protein [Gammaproteobacteria bacterium]